MGSVVVASRLWSTGLIVVAHRLSYFEACGIFLDPGANRGSPALTEGFFTEPPRKPESRSFLTVGTDYCCIIDQGSSPRPQLHPVHSDPRSGEVRAGGKHQHLDLPIRDCSPLAAAATESSDD